MKKNILRALVFSLGAFAGTGQAQDLLELYRRALDSNPALKAREFGVDRAAAQADLQRSRLRPQIVASANYSVNDFDARGAGSSSYDGMRGTIQLRQALFDRSSSLRVQSADAATQQSEQELEAVRMLLAAEVVDRYLLALEGDDQINYVQAEKELTDKQLQRLRKMRERQMAKVTDLYEVEAYFQTLVTKEIEARNAKSVALEKLRETAGVSVAKVAPLAVDTFAIMPRDIELWTRDAVQRNPLLVGLRHALESAKKIIASSKAEYLPRLDLVLSETYADTGFDNSKNPRYNVGTLGLQLNIPLYEGGRVDAGVREAAARYGIAAQEYERKRREIEREVRTAYWRTEADHARIESTNQEVAALEKTREALEKGYELRVNTIVDLLDAQRRLFKARAEQSKARYDYVRSLVDLRIWAGVLGQAEMQKLNTWFFAGSTTPR
jgi:outer membrane protein